MKNTILLFSLAGVFLISSCNDDYQEIPKGAKSNLEIETSITRSVIDATDFKKQDRIGIFVLDNKGESYTSKGLNTPATYDKGWLFDSEITLSEKEAVVYAYYPYDETNKNVSSIFINALYGFSSGQNDYLYGQSNIVNESNPKAFISFKHALARLTISITKDIKDAGNGHLSNVILSNKQGSTAISAYGTMDIKTGKIEPILNETAEINIYMLDTFISSSESTKIDLLVIPTEINQNVILTLNIDGYPYIIELPNMKLEAGQQYTFPVNVNRKSFDIFPQNGTVGNAVDLGLSVKWADHNIGASAPEEAGGLYGWGDPTGEHTEKNSIYYGGTTEKTSQFGIDWDIARAKWGGQWRVPTRLEFKEAILKCTLKWTNRNGVNGLQVIGPNGNSIFLPRAPQRTETNFWAKETGYYWTSSQTGSFNPPAEYTESVIIGVSDYIDYYNNYVGWWEADIAMKYAGLSVRPVTNE